MLLPGLKIPSFNIEIQVKIHNLTTNKIKLRYDQDQ
jgi:hypothetical protein